jgi:anti-anti-sigma factor
MADQTKQPASRSPTLPWELKSEDTGEDTRVYFTGRDVFLDESNNDLINERLLRLVEEKGRVRLLLDMGNISYVTSGTLGMLLILHRKLHSVLGRLVLINVQPHIYEIFAITNLTRLLDVRPAGVKERAS